MSSMLPIAVYGLKVPAGDVMIPATADFPATFRITMAAIDPSATPEHTGTVNGNITPRATLKLVYDPQVPGDEESSEEDSEDEEKFLEALLKGRGSDDAEDEEDEESSSDDEKNGGPSDPSKTKKARQEAAMQQMMTTLAELNEGEDDVDMESSPKTNGLSNHKSNKGKGKALAEDVDASMSDDDSEKSLEGMDEQVLCTLDPQKNYQQTLDITIPEDQRAYFKVSGTHAIYLTGNYVVPADNGHDHDDDDSDPYDMSPDEDELDELEDEDESDELDDLEDPRITEIASEDEGEPPKLIKKDELSKKGKNKRVHENSSDVETPAASLDDIMAKSLKPAEPATNGVMNGEPKLSKKQLKKLKNNAGKPVEVISGDGEVKKADTSSKDSDSLKGDKKVQFAKNLEQGPSASPSTIKSDIADKPKAEMKKDDGKPKASLGVKMVSGVKIDDKKLGTGPAAKKGSKVGMRYIGKLNNGKVFDSNKKGKPFSFTIGEGSVIAGWDIGVAGMSVGGERRIVIPAEKAYGKKGAPPNIPPNSELIFDLKLLEVK